MLIKRLLLMSLLILLSSSSFLFEPYFNKLANDNLVTSDQLSYALKHNIKQAHQVNFSQSEKGSQGWLQSGSYLANQSADIAYALGHYFHETEQHNLSNGYLEKAAALNHLIAIEQLADNAYQASNFQLVKALFSKVDEPTFQLTKLYVKSLMASGDLAKLDSIKDQLFTEYKGTSFLTSLIRFNVFNTNYFEVNQECDSSITLIASNYDDLTQWLTLSEQYQQRSVKDFLCVKQIRYIANLTAWCPNEYNNKALSCDESLFKEYAKELHSDYLAVMLPEGGANVHYGILYLDREDDIDVFTHEVLHLLGFVDEYPLPVGHSACSWGDFEVGYNIAVVNNHLLVNNTLNMSLAKQLPWYQTLAKYLPKDAQQIPINQAITEQGIGVFTSATCQNNQVFTALKPVFTRTSLTNHDVELPPIYLKLLAQSPKQFNLPSFEFNIARQLLVAGQLTQANYWLKKAELYRNAKLTERLLEKGY